MTKSNAFHISMLASITFHLGLASAQLNLTNRGCLPKEVFHPSNTTYATRNATGTHIGKPFPAPGTILPSNASIIVSNDPSNWTWSIGVQQIPGAKLINSFVWVDTYGTDLSKNASVKGFDLCYIAMQNTNLGAQRRGRGENGDCSNLLFKDCVADWADALVQEALHPTISNSSTTPCEALVRSAYNSPSCNGLEFGLQLADAIPSKSPARNCSFGQGDPDYDSALPLTYGPPKTRNASDFDVAYDIAVTTIIPMFVLGWHRDGLSDAWARADAMCLKPTDFEVGSRVTKNFPRSGASLWRISGSGLGVMVVSLIWSFL